MRADFFSSTFVKYIFYIILSLSITFKIITRYAKLHADSNEPIQGHLVEGEDSDTFFSLLSSEIYN
jgi:hypothetical protein